MEHLVEAKEYMAAGQYIAYLLPRAGRSDTKALEQFHTYVGAFHLV